MRAGGSTSGGPDDHRSYDLGSPCCLLLGSNAFAQQSPTPAGSMPLIDVSSVIGIQPPSRARSPIRPSWSARAAGMKIANALAERALIERLDSRAIWRLPPKRRSSACRRSTGASYPARQWRHQSRSGVADRARCDVDDADRRNDGRHDADVAQVLPSLCPTPCRSPDRCAFR